MKEEHKMKHNDRQMYITKLWEEKNKFTPHSCYLDLLYREGTANTSQSGDFWLGESILWSLYGTVKMAKLCYYPKYGPL